MTDFIMDDFFKKTLKKHGTPHLKTLYKELQDCYKSPETFTKSSFIEEEIEDKESFLQEMCFVFTTNFLNLLSYNELKINLKLANAICENFNTLDKCDFLCDLYEVMQEDDWCKLFISQWIYIETADFISERISQIIKSISIEKLRSFMSDSDKEAWSNLPENIEVYRGCIDSEKHGMSWSVKKHIAEEFAYRKSLTFNNDAYKSLLFNRTINIHLKEKITNSEKQNVKILSGTVNKKDCIVFMSNSEAEIFSYYVKITDSTIYENEK